MVKVAPIVLDNNGEPDLYRSTLVLRGRGKLGGAGGFGFARFGYSKLGQPAGEGGILHNRVTGYNNKVMRKGAARKRYQVRMRYYRPTNPRTPAQQAQRAKLSAAWQSWRALAPVEKSRYIERAKKNNRMPHAVYISWYMKNH